MHHKDTIGRGMNIELHPVAVSDVAGGRSGPKSRDGVLQSVTGSPSMADNQRPTFCGKVCGIHVPPVWMAWKLLEVNSDIHIVYNEMWTLFTVVVCGMDRPAASRQQPVRLFPHPTRLTKPMLIRRLMQWH